MSNDILSICYILLSLIEMPWFGLSFIIHLSRLLKEVNVSFKGFTNKQQKEG